MQKINMHLITDSTGETISNIANVIMSQFPGYKAEIFLWPFIQHKSQLEVVIGAIEKKPGLALYTIIKPEFISILEKKFAENTRVKIIPTLSQAVFQCSAHIGANLNQIEGRTEVKDGEYQHRMDAITYTMNHDDGKLMEEMYEAEIMLIGVSRTSKTPTGLYLAYRGYKVINIPFVSVQTMRPELIAKFKGIIIGLSIDSQRLLQLRKNRMSDQKEQIHCQNYINLESIEDELNRCRRFLNTLNCHIIDVTTKSVEEISAHIIKIHNLVRD